jgi:hypothetical protein
MLFLGFVGFINVIVLIPVIIALHVWEYQLFVIPSNNKLLS